MTEWLRGWRAKGWRKSDGKPVLNVDLWQALEAAAAPHQVTWTWTRGHVGHPLNERADQVISEEAEGSKGRTVECALLIRGLCSRTLSGQRP